MQKDRPIGTFINRNLAQHTREIEESQLDKLLLENSDFNDLMQILSNGWDTPEPTSTLEIEDAFNKLLQRMRE